VPLVGAIGAGLLDGATDGDEDASDDGDGDASDEGGTPPTWPMPDLPRRLRPTIATTTTAAAPIAYLAIAFTWVILRADHPGRRWGVEGS
jgi:hypothetical protein